MSHERIDRREQIKHDTELECSYGAVIPQPSLGKGDYMAMGELAGSTNTATSVVPKRNITFEDSVEDNRKNQPKSH